MIQADHEARRMAGEALVRISEHEKACNERMDEVRDFHKEIRGDQKLQMRWLIGTLVTVVGFLFSKVMGWV